MHVRGSKGGTIYSRNEQLRKINTKTDHTAGAVYGEISQDGRFGYSPQPKLSPFCIAIAPNVWKFSINAVILS
jgi:hypothetical protein